MVPDKIQDLTLEHELLCNTIILKSEPPYYAFTHRPEKNCENLSKF
jgi:hypothetical protein